MVHIREIKYSDNSDVLRIDSHFLHLISYANCDADDGVSLIVNNVFFNNVGMYMYMTDIVEIDLFVELHFDVYDIRNNLSYGFVHKIQVSPIPLFDMFNEILGYNIPKQMRYMKDCCDCFGQMNDNRVRLLELDVNNKINSFISVYEKIYKYIPNFVGMLEDYDFLSGVVRDLYEEEHFLVSHLLLKKYMNLFHRMKCVQRVMAIKCECGTEGVFRPCSCVYIEKMDWSQVTTYVC